MGRKKRSHLEDDGVDGSPQLHPGLHDVGVEVEREERAPVEQGQAGPGAEGVAAVSIGDGGFGVVVGAVVDQGGGVYGGVHCRRRLDSGLNRGHHQDAVRQHASTSKEPFSITK